MFSFGQGGRDWCVFAKPRNVLSTRRSGLPFGPANRNSLVTVDPHCTRARGVARFASSRGPKIQETSSRHLTRFSVTRTSALGLKFLVLVNGRWIYPCSFEPHDSNNQSHSLVIFRMTIRRQHIATRYLRQTSGPLPAKETACRHRSP